MNKLSKIILVILIFNLFFIVNVLATDNKITMNNVNNYEEVVNSDEGEYVEIEEVTYVNPLYRDIIDEDDLNYPSNIMTFSEPEKCKTIEEAGNQLRDNIKQRNETIKIYYITNSNLTTDIYTKLSDEALKHTGVPTEGDYMAWQYAGWRASATGNVSSGVYNYTITFTYTYYTTYDQEEEMNTAVSNLLNKLNLSGTDYEKITKIYDYICNNITYDYTSDGTLKHTAYAALINKTAVCQGYAVLFYRLALENNIDARFISGQGNGGAHGWNIVKIGDYYYNVDSTWDATYAQNNLSYRYYMLTDSNFISHTRDSEYSTSEFYSKYPMGIQNYTAEMNEEDKNKAQLNGLILDEETGCYSYYENGNINTEFTGLYEQDNEMWYVISGKVDLAYNGIYTDETGTYIIKNNKVDKDCTKVEKIDNVWRMVIDGKVDYEYTGIGTNDLGTWYVENGKVNFNYTGIYTDETETYLIENGKVKTDCTEVMKIDGTWRMVINGKIDYQYTGVGSNSLGTWYVENGEVNFDYTGTYFEGNIAYIIENGKVKVTCQKDTPEVIKIDGIWRMVINGKVDYEYTGIGSNSLGTWYVENGKVNFNYIGKYTDETGTYLIENGKVKTDCTEVMKIDGTWRMVINGKIDYQYTGIGSNSLGTWYVENGEVNFDYIGTYFEGNIAYIIENGKVKVTCQKDTPEVIKIDGIWRMVINGEIDYEYTGIGSNSLGTWYVENGKVTFEYTGSYTDETGTYVIEKSQVKTDYTKVMRIDGTWRMVINGKVDYEYTGIGTNEYGTWYVEDGKVTFEYTGTYYEGDKAYIIEKSQVRATVQREYTGVEKIAETWRMVINGAVDYNYTGLGTNGNGTWYVENGKVTFEYTDSYTDETGTYVIEKSQVKTDYTKVMRIDGTWRMVINGKVDYEYTGIGTNEYGTWYVEDGKVTFEYIGTYYEGEKAYIIEKSQVRVIVTKDTTEVIKVNETWRMVVNGKVDYEYTGIGTNPKGMWLLQNGAVNFNYTGQYEDSDGSIYNIVKGEVREVISRAGHPGTMWVDQPVKNSKHITGSLDVSGWALTEETGDIIQIYLDNKYVGNASRNERDDVFEVYKNNEYGGIEFTPLPGYYYKLNTAGLSKGTHIVKIVNLASDGKTIIQSREVAFTITNLTKTWGIDVSKYQGDIDWNSVKNSGVEFAILRIGYYIQSKNQIVLDEYFNTYYNECKRLGIAVGGYFYSYAFNSAEAAQEASACLSLISGKSFEMPIFLDVEDNILKNAVANGSTNVSELTNASVTFCDMMNNAGYKGGVYASKNFFNTYLNTAVLEKYNIWLAHYTTETDYTGKFDMWQYTSDGSVPGINGPVDLDWCFSRYF